MTLVELRYIVALAAEGNFSRAAERCAVSQPTLSVAIARIESELGVQLFERAKGFVSPSPVGAEIVRQARLALHEADKIRDIALHGRNQLAGSLRLGVIHTVGPYLLPPLIVELKRLAPDMPLVIEENMTAALSDMLHDNEIDVAVIALPFDLPGVQTMPLYDESFVVIVPRGHAWEGRNAINPEEVSGDDVLLLKAGNCFRDQVLGACPQISKAETDIHLGYSIGTLRWMVASGLGVSILPASAAQRPYVNDLVTVLPFAPPEPSRRIALAFRAGFARPEAIKAIAQAVREMKQPAFRLVAPPRAAAAE
jgi:LysR family hydrogen peroxide-inducible transcriptional activator